MFSSVSFALSSRPSASILSEPGDILVKDDVEEVLLGMGFTVIRDVAASKLMVVDEETNDCVELSARGTEPREVDDAVLEAG